MLKNSCGKLHCQKGFNLNPFSYKILGVMLDQIQVSGVSSLEEVHLLRRLARWFDSQGLHQSGVWLPLSEAHPPPISPGVTLPAERTRDDPQC